MSLKDRLKTARINAGLERSDVTKKLGFTAQAVRDWEEGGAIPRDSTLEQLAKLYGCKISQKFEIVSNDPDIRAADEIAENLTHEILALNVKNRLIIQHLVGMMKHYTDAPEAKISLAEKKRRRKPGDLLLDDKTGETSDGDSTDSGSKNRN